MAQRQRLYDYVPPEQRLMGYGEVLGSLMSSAVAEPLAGWAGLATGNPAAIDATRKMLTYEPRTQQGQENMQAIGEAMEPVASGLEWLEQKAGDLGYAIGGPTGGAIGATIPTALGAMIPGGYAAKKLAGANYPEVPSGGVDGRQRGMIAGRSANNADLEALKQAELMKADGIDADTIYAQTKWWLDHPDGQPRFEIDDSKSELLPYLTESSDEFTSKMSDILRHPELSKSHPSIIEDTDFASLDLGNPRGLRGSFKRGQGGFIDDKITINRNLGDEGKRSTVLHEGQHNVQHKDNLSQGGSPASAQAVYYDSLRDKYNAGDYRKINNKYDNINYELKPLWEADSINHFLNIKQPRQLFNTSDYYAMSDKLREHLGPPPKRNQLAWAQRAGELIAMDKMNGLEYGIKKLVKEESPTEIKRRIRNLEARRNRLPIGKIAEASELRREMRNNNPTAVLSEQEQYALYERLGGESEARLTQDRMDMPMDERLANPFYKNYDVPFDDMILRNTSLMR